MMDDRDFFELLERVLASGMRAMQAWEDSEGRRPCIADYVEAFMRQHDSRQWQERTADNDERYFRAIQTLANEASGVANTDRLKRAIETIRREAGHREREAFLGRIIPGVYWQPVKPCQGQKPLRFMEFEPA